MARHLQSVTIAIAALLAGAALAQTGVLTEKDTRYLESTYGPTVRAEIVSRMKPEELERLHTVINQTFAADYPGIRYNMVADYLFTVHMQQCQAWSAAHPEQVCPPPENSSIVPGKNVADRQCNACHLFGTSVAPAFRAMAKSGKVSAASLAAAIKQGHRMSPIDLSPEQVKDLAAYIQALK